MVIISLPDVINVLLPQNMIIFQGVAGALTVLMKDAIRPNLMQTLEVRSLRKCFCAKSVIVVKS